MSDMLVEVATEGHAAKRFHLLSGHVFVSFNSLKSAYEQSKSSVSVFLVVSYRGFRVCSLRPKPSLC